MEPVRSVARCHDRHAGPVAVGQPVVRDIDRPVIGAVGPGIDRDCREAAGPRFGEPFYKRSGPVKAAVVAVGDGHRYSALVAHRVTRPEPPVWAPGDDGVDVLALVVPGLAWVAPRGAVILGDPDRRPAAAHRGRRHVDVLGHYRDHAGVEWIRRDCGLRALGYEMLGDGGSANRGRSRGRRTRAGAGRGICGRIGAERGPLGGDAVGRARRRVGGCGPGRQTERNQRHRDDRDDSDRRAGDGAYWDAAWRFRGFALAGQRPPSIRSMRKSTRRRF